MEKWQVLAALLLRYSAVKVLLPGVSPVTTEVALLCCWAPVCITACVSVAGIMVAPDTAKLMKQE